MDKRAGQPATPEDLVDIEALLDAYYDNVPDPAEDSQRVSFGTSGHRGSSFTTSFNEAHIAAVTAAVIEYRTRQGYTGPLFLGRDTHALSEIAFLTANEVLAAAGVPTFIDEQDTYTPTPVVSHAIITHNAGLNDGAGRGAGAAGSAAFAGSAGMSVPAGLADGIIITPSHNPPQDGGIKYNPPHGGPAGAEVTAWIENRANELLADWKSIPRTSFQRAFHLENTTNFDYITHYVEDLDAVIDMEAIQQSGLKIAADPLGGAAVDYWAAIGERFGIDIDLVNPVVDPAWGFMTLDWDGKIRMDCSSPSAMARLIDNRDKYDLAIGNDPDADRHGIVTPDGGLMNPNHYLAVAIDYLFRNRSGWGKEVAIGKTLVSSSLIDRVAAGLGRTVAEVPVGFKWFVDGLTDGSLGFGGEESAGASFLRKNGSVWTTDKDGILLGLLAAEITAVTGASPSAYHRRLVEQYGASSYARIDAPATPAQKQALKGLAASAVTAETLAGEPITAKLTEAPGNGAAIGGLKVTTENAWFAARPSGTEDVYKIYAESFKGDEHLAQVQKEAQEVVDSVI